MRIVKKFNASITPSKKVKLYSISAVKMVKDQVIVWYVEDDAGKEDWLTVKLFEVGEPIETGYTVLDIVEDSMGRFWVVCYKIGG